MESKLLRCPANCSRVLIFVACLLAVCASSAVRAELLPEQTAVLVSPTEDSKRVATHYVLARNLPEGNVLILDKAYPNVISRKTWNEEVRPQWSSLSAGCAR